MKIAYVKWADASYSNKSDERPLEELTGTTELEEVGFLLREDKDTITLALENQDGATTSRIWMIIPRCNIVSLYTRQLADAFPQLKRKRQTLRVGKIEQPARSVEPALHLSSPAADT
jgi:hypothetical protein